jgi:serine/threonine protein kinase
MKASALSTRDKENIYNELLSHYEMDHENIIKLYDHSEQGNLIYLLLEHAEGGNLFTYLNKHIRLDVQLIAKIFVQSCRAVEHVHSKGFIHRDLKPENILLDKGVNVKLCDFGWCTPITDHAYRKIVSGTYEYMSPETLHGQLQGYESDIWSLGVLLYELHHNIEPFKGRSVREVLNSIKNCPLNFDISITPEAKDLILRLLQVDPAARLNFQQIYSHPFVIKYGPTNIPRAPQPEARDGLKRAQSTNICTRVISAQEWQEENNRRRIQRDPSIQANIVEPRHAYASTRITQEIPRNTETRINYRPLIPTALVPSPELQRKESIQTTSRVFGAIAPKREVQNFVSSSSYSNLRQEPIQQYSVGSLPTTSTSAATTHAPIILSSTDIITRQRDNSRPISTLESQSPTTSTPSSSSLNLRQANVLRLKTENANSQPLQQVQSNTQYQSTVTGRRSSNIGVKVISSQPFGYEARRESENKENNGAYSTGVASPPSAVTPTSTGINVYDIKGWDQVPNYIQKRPSDNVVLQEQQLKPSNSLVFNENTQIHSSYFDKNRNVISQVRPYVGDQGGLKISEIKQVPVRPIETMNASHPLRDRIIPTNTAMARMSRERPAFAPVPMTNKPVMIRQNTYTLDADSATHNAHNYSMSNIHTAHPFRRATTFQ